MNEMSEGPRKNQCLAPRVLGSRFQFKLGTILDKSKEAD